MTDVDPKHARIFDEITTILSAKYTEASIRRWLDEPNAHLAGVIPADAINSGEGYAVREVAYSIAIGGAK